MAKAKEKVISMLATATVDLQHGDSKTVVYSVPIGKKAVITHVVIRNPTASLDSGGTGDFDIGSGANATSWLQTTDLDTMTATTDYMVIMSSKVKYTIEPFQTTAANNFGIKPITGATLDAQATMEVFGYEMDA